MYFHSGAAVILDGEMSVRGHCSPSYHRCCTFNREGYYSAAMCHFRTLLMLSTMLSTSIASAGEPDISGVDIIVASDGSGDFVSLQTAIDTIPGSNTRRITIFVRDGIYEEKVLLRQDRITIVGQSRDGVRLQFYCPRSEYNRRYDNIGPAVLNIYGSDVVIRSMTIENTQATSEHSFALYGQPQRLILDDCNILGVGGDTVSLWNTSFGMYYHHNCRFKGSVDFVCPRGWCFVRDCHFESANRNAALWHDGHMDLDMKFVLRNCTFDGPPRFVLGRNQYPSQFYLLDCQFSANMADQPIHVAKDISNVSHPEVYKQKYFYNCHRENGDYAWHADNLTTAAGAPSPDEITPNWTFGGRWDPESVSVPKIVEVETRDDEVHIYLSECVTGVEHAEVIRGDGSVATFKRGDGSSRLVFRGGNVTSTPQRLDSKGDSILGAISALLPRRLDSQALPDASPRDEIKIVLVGDSTVATYSADHAYQGWGWALDRLLDDRVTVINEARGGRSSKSYRAEGHWKRALRHQPDYVLIQFGHNDNLGKGPKRETDSAPGGDFRANLARYVEEARVAGATVVLVSPTTRRKFTDTGVINPAGNNLSYAEAVLTVAQDLDCPVVDMNRLTRRLFERLGEKPSNWIQPIGDTTHFSPAGAKRVAATLAGELVDVEPSLKRYLLPNVLDSY